VRDRQYATYLEAAGFRPKEALADGTEVWENPRAVRLPEGERRFGEPDAGGVLWGTLPLAFLTAAIALASGRWLAGIDRVRAMAALARQDLRETWAFVRDLPARASGRYRDAGRPGSGDSERGGARGTLDFASPISPAPLVGATPEQERL
jgi:hypothetical protein